MPKESMAMSCHRRNVIETPSGAAIGHVTTALVPAGEVAVTVRCPLAVIEAARSNSNV
jgi:hypothetical protein